MKNKFLSIFLSIIMSCSCMFIVSCGESNSTLEDDSISGNTSSSEELPLDENINFDDWVGNYEEECYLGDKYSLDLSTVKSNTNRRYRPKYTVTTTSGEYVEILNNQFLLYNLDGYKVTYKIVVEDKTFTKNIKVNVINNIKPVIANDFAFDGGINALYTLPNIVVADAFSQPINEYTVKLFKKNEETLTEIPYDTKNENNKIIRTFTPTEMATYVIKIEADFEGIKNVKEVEFYVGNDDSRYEVRNFNNPNESKEGVDFSFIPVNGTLSVEWLPEFQGKRGVIKVSYTNGGYINFAIKPKHEKRVYEGNWHNFRMELFVPEAKDCANRIMGAAIEWKDDLHTASWLNFKDGVWSDWIFGTDRFLPNYDALANLNTKTGKIFFETENSDKPGVFYIGGFYQEPME